MTQSITIPKIRSFIGDELYYQAVDGVQMGHVKKTELFGNSIQSEVQGDDIYPYIVEIRLNPQGMFSNVTCSCSTPRVCVHIGEALVAFVRQKKKPAPVKNPENKPPPGRANRPVSRGRSPEILSVAPLPFIEMDQRKQGLTVNLFFKYNKTRVSINDRDDMVFVKPSKEQNRPPVYIKRDRELEWTTKKRLDEIFSKISRVNPGSAKFHENFPHDDYAVPLSLRQFMTRYSEPISQTEIEIRLKGRRHRVTHSEGSFAFRASSEINWLSLDARYVSPNGSESSVDINSSFLQKGVVRVGDSLVVPEKEEIRSIEKLVKQGMNSSGFMKVSILDLNLIDSLYDDIINKDEPALARAKRISQKLKANGHRDTYPLPLNFKGNLRPYQYAGYNWLRFLHEHDLNGCLADDMGLGKTVQTLAFLQALKEKALVEKVPFVSLIVLPVITMANWENEINKFTPSLSCTRHSGSGRVKTKEHLEQFNCILVSYHTLKNDHDLFAGMRFDYIILDEAQYIKNSSSKIFKSVRALFSGHRLSLTGTPVENNTGELWSQMDFLNPGMLGSREDFANTYSRPIEKHGSSGAAEQLKKRIYPFILRRRKEEAAPDLPPKEEIIIYAEMGSRQAELYESCRRRYRDSIEQTIREQGINKSTIHIFDALLKLRQIALFPSLVYKDEANAPSCKFDMMKDMIDEIIREDHKMLIFSSFTSSLAIVRNYFDKEKISYSYIDGAARNREEEIIRFREDQNRKVFLLSLKAGGVGINLTEAEYVFLFDPWWNPAVEQQAIDRSHRIGQTNKVIAYKMIVKNTVEEKILRLQEKKKELVKELITEESGFFKSLSSNDIMDLFD
ncbi:MAG: DEAD/DEAH box helicase [bacterium]|nr:DEAD/DEAH box helicase [bacterium]